MNRNRIILLGVLAALVLLSVGAMAANHLRDGRENESQASMPMELAETDPIPDQQEATIQTEESSKPGTESPEDKETVLGTWVYQGEDYTEYVSFGSGKEYGYLAVPKDGTEQSFSGSYQMDGQTLTIRANGERYKRAFTLQRGRLVLDGKPYSRFMEEGAEEHMQDQTEASSNAATKKSRRASEESKEKPSKQVKEMAGGN